MINEKKPPELLSPAGNFEKMKAAILYGADAVYLAGDDFGMRAAADNFRFILEYLHDKRTGSEWFWCVDKHGMPTPEKPIVEPWKCPYHNGRMCLELMRREPDIYV